MWKEVCDGGVYRGSIPKDESTHRYQHAHEECATCYPFYRRVVEMCEVFPSVGARLGIWVRIVKVDIAVEAQHLDM